MGKLSDFLGGTSNVAVLDDLDDVAIPSSPSPAEGDALVFNSGVWSNQPISAGTTLLTYNGVPPASLGVDGDYCINLQTSNVYKKMTPSIPWEAFDGSQSSFEYDAAPFFGNQGEGGYPGGYWGSANIWFLENFGKVTFLYQGAVVQTNDTNRLEIDDWNAIPFESIIGQSTHLPLDSYGSNSDGQGLADKDGANAIYVRRNNNTGNPLLTKLITPLEAIDSLTMTDANVLGWSRTPYIVHLSGDDYVLVVDVTHIALGTRLYVAHITDTGNTLTVVNSQFIESTTDYTNILINKLTSTTFAISCGTSVFPGELSGGSIIIGSEFVIPTPTYGQGVGTVTGSKQNSRDSHRVSDTSVIICVHWSEQGDLNSQTTALHLIEVLGSPLSCSQLEVAVNINGLWTDPSQVLDFVNPHSSIYYDETAGTGYDGSGFVLLRTSNYFGEGTQRHSSNVLIPFTVLSNAITVGNSRPYGKSEDDTWVVYDLGIPFGTKKILAVHNDGEGQFRFIRDNTTPGTSQWVMESETMSSLSPSAYSSLRSPAQGLASFIGGVLTPNGPIFTPYGYISNTQPVNNALNVKSRSLINILHITTQDANITFNEQDGGSETYTHRYSKEFIVVLRRYVDNPTYNWSTADGNNSILFEGNVYPTLGTATNTYDMIKVVSYNGLYFVTVLGIEYPLNDDTTSANLKVSKSAKIVTTDATPTTALSLGVGDDTSMTFTVHGFGRSTTGEVKWSVIDGCVKNESAVSPSMATVGGLNIVEDEDAISPAIDWSIDVSPNDSTNALDIVVTGAAATTITWNVRIEGVKG